jgi:hypothetical protein
MRKILIATLVAAGLGLAGTSPTLAVPASGNAIEDAAAANPLLQPAWWHHHYHWHWWHRW